MRSSGRSSAEASCHKQHFNISISIMSLLDFCSKVSFNFYSGRAFCLPKICYCSVNHYVGLSCIQWRASNRHGRPPVGVAWNSSMQGLQGEGRGLYNSGQACCDALLRAVLAWRAGLADSICYRYHFINIIDVNELRLSSVMASHYWSSS